MRLLGEYWIGPFTAAGVLMTGAPAVASSASSSPTAVIELFTSQGCSSCPPADALVGRLRKDPRLLVLSFHVDYWDSLGWKDPWSSAASTERQYAYARSVGERTVFTPQIVVNGTRSVLGSSESGVQHAILAAHESAFPASVELSPTPEGGFRLQLSGAGAKGDIWEVRYTSHAITPIGAGENSGRRLETFNNVSHITRLGAFAPGTLSLAPLSGADDGLAVIIQSSPNGRVIGAAAYNLPGG